jgi:hypothetical protein
MPATRGPSSLPISDWPSADRNAWMCACRPAVRLTPGGAASRMSPDIQQTNARAYGHFLAYCCREGALNANAPAAVTVTPDRIAAFLAELSRRVGSVTRYNYACRILRVATILSPGGISDGCARWSTIGSTEPAPGQRRIASSTATGSSLSASRS